MKIKKGASISGLDIRMRPALIAGEEIWKNHGKELVVTAGLDGEHSAGSLHYYGLALDFRTKYFTSKTEIDEIVLELKAKLGSSFDVILHSNHIHVEYDQP